MALRRSGGASERRGTPSDLVVLGLANPGEEFESSRHNVGGDAVRVVAARHHVTLKLEPRQRCLSATIAAPVGRVTLAVPTTYMNESGACLPGLFKRTGADVGQLLVCHDELDFEPGRLQLKIGGGLAGHNGLRSIESVTKSREFARLRIGIGKPPTKEQGADHVLKRLTGKRKEELVATVNEAADAIELVLGLGVLEAQQRVNVSNRD